LTATPYALIIASDVTLALQDAREIASEAIRERRLHIIPGNRGSQQFPTDQARAAIKRFFNRAGSDPIHRSRRIGILLYKFFSGARSRSDAEVTARELASHVGYGAADTVVVRANDQLQLRDHLASFGLADPVVQVVPATFLDALHSFAAEFPHDALVSQRAIKSATGWGFNKPEEILRDLRVIHMLYGRLTDMAGQPIERRARKDILFAATGLTLGYEAPATIAKFRTSTFPELKDRELKYPLHAKYSYNDTRIYFWFPDSGSRSTEKIKTVVAHAGAHLPTGTRGDDL
jgi:hypothetical protein